MDDDVQANFSGELQLLLEEAGLFRFVSAVVDFRLDLFLGRSLERLDENLGRLAILCEFPAGQRMIVQTRLADRDHARVLRQFPQG